MKQKHKPFYKLTAICLSLSMTAASFMMNNVFASEDVVFPETDYLTGQPLLDELRDLGLGQDYENIEELPVPEEQIPPEEGEGTGSEVTDPEVTDPEVTDPEVTDPEVTDPEVTDPEVTDPEVTDPEVTDPEVTDPEVTDPEVTDPEITDPEVTDPEVTDPEVTDPEVTDPEVTDPEVTDPEVTDSEAAEAIENASLLGVFHLPLQIFYAEGEEEQLTDTHEPAEDPVLSTDETTGSTDETTGSTDETTGSTDETTGSTDETTGSTDETTGSTDETTGSTDETTGSTDETTGSTDETTGSTDETTGSSDESTESSDSEPVIDPGFGVDPVDPGFGVDPNQPVEEIPEESVPEATLPSREVLVAYVQELDVEQIVSLDDTNITEIEYVDLYSMLTEEQKYDVFAYLYPAQDVTEPGPLIENTSPFQMFSLFSFMNDEEENEEDGLHLEKTATDNRDGTFELTLEAYVDGTVDTVETPLDVVLVLDTSGSMDERFSDGEKKINVLKTSVNNLIEQLCNSSIETNPNRLNVVTFASGAKNIFTNMQACTVEKKEFIKSEVSAKLVANGGTDTNEGMSKANDIIQSIKDDPNRQRVVILFTDGVPGDGNVWNFNIDVAHGAVKHAYEIHKVPGTTIYTVGIYDNANPAILYGDGYNIFWEWYDCNGAVGDEWGGSVQERDTEAANRMMNLISSNYSHMGFDDLGAEFSNWGRYVITKEVQPEDKNPDGEYFLSASNQEKLKEIFENLTQIITNPSLELGSGTQLKDYVSPYFEIVENTVETYTAKCTSFTKDADGNVTAEWGDPQKAEMTVQPTADTEDPGIIVTGFDYGNNFVASTDSGARGSKLIVKFDVRPKADFLGGNAVPTNTDTSGVYKASGGEVGSFPIPKVDVPINPVTIKAVDKNVYLMGDLTEKQLKEGATVIIQDANKNPIHVNPNAPYAKMESWQHKFVDITITAPTESMTNLKEDKGYTLSAKVTPKTPGTAVEQKNSATAQIKVFKPEITWRDSAINAGETPNYDNSTSTQIECNFVKAEWKHDGTLDTADDVVMTGQQPTLAYAYNPVAAPISAETKVNVTVRIEGTDVTQYVTFHHDRCDFDGCTSTFDPEKCEFIVHIKTFDLKITKEVEGMYVAGDTFRFTVTGSDGFRTSFTLGNGTWSVTLKGLDVGTYTVTEDTGWSWRYTAGTSSRTVTADNIQDGKAEVTFTNSNRTNQWLSWEGTVKNNFDPVP